jgi:perosamine synthetase
MIHTTQRNIPLCEAEITAEDVAAVTECLAGGWLSSVAPCVAEFEQAFKASLVGMGASPLIHVAATQSGTSALWMGLHVLGLKPGDEILCPASSFVASVNPLLYHGLRLKLVDIEAGTLAPTLAAFQAARTPATKAVLVAHLCGFGMPELLLLRQWCDEEGLFLIEDAAEALGTTVQGMPVGSVGHIGVFSFNINKTITTASGGMLVATDEALVQAIRHQSTQAKCYAEGELYHDALGFNLRMNALHAALGLSQLKRLPTILKAKRAIAQRYYEGLHPHVHVLYESPEASRHYHPSYWLNVIRLPDLESRQRMQHALVTQGIQVRPYFMPFTELPHVQPALTGIETPCRETLPVAYALWETALTLPSSATLLPEVQDLVINAIKVSL